MDFRHTPLGVTSSIPPGYAPDVLRAVARPDREPSARLCGEDLWTLWEVSWRRAADGMPVAASAQMRVPADSPSVCESKSLKLYLMGLNEERFHSADEVAAVIERDVGRCCGAPVALELWLDDGSVPAPSAEPAGLPASRLLEAEAEAPLAWPQSPEQALEGLVRPARGNAQEQRWHTHLFRSLCPVTGQPDWASIYLWCRGGPLEPAGLLAYLLSFRRHGALHEQCVERIATDLQASLGLDELTVEARFLRRGGIDINPWRGTRRPLPMARRLWRQ